MMSCQEKCIWLQWLWCEYCFLSSRALWPKSFLAMHLLVLAEVRLMDIWFISKSWACLFLAVFPVVTGTVLSFKGASALTFITVPLAASMVVLWGFFPSRTPIRDSSVWRHTLLSNSKFKYNIRLQIDSTVEPDRQDRLDSIDIPRHRKLYVQINPDIRSVSSVNRATTGSY